jgi:hypothetical protein
MAKPQEKLSSPPAKRTAINANVINGNVQCPFCKGFMGYDYERGLLLCQRNSCSNFGTRYRPPTVTLLPE